MESDNKTYEINYLLSPLIPEDKVGEEVAVLRKAIEDKNSFIVGEDQVKMQKLAYPIAKYVNAYYGWFRFSSNPQTVSQIKSSFEKNDKILRAMLTEAAKDNPIRFASRKSSRSKEASQGEIAEKTEIKPEEIDQKLDAILAAGGEIKN
ncbi:30S ribosomal protein S6 [Candidatus Parcubacteria bacterium]|nr:MAG: 30S ribosomal protein S6 [Candidatus Parcubacteria bacterium]